MSGKKWIVIGISGATCSGKTTLAKELHQEFKNCTVLHQDDYFLAPDDSRQTRIPELNHNNWELITSVDMTKMYSDILEILQGTPKDEITGGNLLILDGFLLFQYQPISDLCNAKYFLTLTKEQCWDRRQNRHYDPPDVPGYFDKVVWPEYLKNMVATERNKDLYKSITFIDGSKSKKDIFEMVFTELKKLLC